MCSSSRLYTDWCMAVPTEKATKTAKWNEFVTIMTQYYKQTENITLKHFQFRSNLHKENETFIALCNRVALEVKHCNFSCESPKCTAKETAVRDKIIIVLKDNEICQEALKRSWDLELLRKKDMKIENVSRGGAEISRENRDIFKLGPYSYRNMQDRQNLNDQQHKRRKKLTSSNPIQCYNCGNNVNGAIIKHKSSCPACNTKCYNCHITGHFRRLCKNKDTKKIEQPDKESQQNK